MQRSLAMALLLAAGMLLVGDGYAQQTPAASHTAATPQSGPAATTPKAAPTAKPPVKKTGTAAKSAAAPALTTRKQKFSYALGMNIGSGLGANLKKQSVDVDFTLVSQGLKDAMSGSKTRLTQEEAQSVLTEVETEVRKNHQENAHRTGAANTPQAATFLPPNTNTDAVA